MADRIAVRNVSPEVLKALENLASSHDRSLESEARYALRSWVLPLLQKEERSARRSEISARLQELLRAVNSTRTSSFLRPSHIAMGIGEQHVEPVEQWFTGEREPSLSQLDAVARFLGGATAWLQHGDGSPYAPAYERLLEDPRSCIQWLTSATDGQELRHLHLIRSDSKEGQLAIVKQDKDWRCQIYTTPCHVSEEVGGGGGKALASLAVSLRLLYSEYAATSTTEVESYVMGIEDFLKLIDGRVHPLHVLQSAKKLPWWEDLWNEDQFRRENAKEYWHGWRSLCERVAELVEADPYLRDQRDQIATRNRR